MSANPTISGPARRILDDRRRVAIDLKCVKCGYNVRTLRDDGRCPECGNAVAVTVRLYQQWFNHGEWLTAACSGISILLGGALFGLPILLLASWMMTLPPQKIDQDAFVGVGTFALASGLAGAVLVLIGLREISKRDPAELELPLCLNARSVLRACLWATLLLPMSGLIAVFSDSAIIWYCTAAVFLTHVIVLPVAAFARIAELMRECEDEKTAAMAATLCITTAILGGAVVAGVLAGSRVPGLFEISGRFLGVVALLTTMATVVLLIRANRTSVALLQRLQPQRSV